MNNEQRLKLIEKEVKELLIDFHKGESYGITLKKLMDVYKGVISADERRFVYVLQGLHMSRITKGINKEKIEAYNEAVDENNFAVNLAVHAILGDPDEMQ